MYGAGRARSAIGLSWEEKQIALTQLEAATQLLMQNTGLTNSHQAHAVYNVGVSVISGW